MSKPRNRSADYAVYLAVRLVVCFLQAMPAPIAFWVADRFAWIIYRFVPSRRRIAMENLTASFPHLSTVNADRIVRAMYRHFLRAALECLLLPRKFHITNWRAFADLYPGKQVLGHLFADRPTLVVTAHYGNWEIAGYLLGVVGFRTHAIARVLDNPFIEQFALRLRQSTGKTIIAKKDDFDRLTDVMKHGGKVATLADQDAGQRGVFVEFFGRPASTHKAVALMAIEFDAPMLVIGIPRVNRSDRTAAPALPGMEGTFYAIEVEDVIDPRDYATQPNAIQAITARYTSALERLIRRHPEQYFWLHRRWKHQPKARVKPEKKAA